MAVKLLTFKGQRLNSINDIIRQVMEDYSALSYDRNTLANTSLELHLVVSDRILLTLMIMKI